MPQWIYYVTSATALEQQMSRTQWTAFVLLSLIFVICIVGKLIYNRKYPPKRREMTWEEKVVFVASVVVIAILALSLLM